MSARAMTGAVVRVMATVNASYGANLSPRDLAARLVDTRSVASCDASVFAFLSEVAPALQGAFLAEMGVDKPAAIGVARLYAAKSGYPLDLVL